MTYWVYIMSSGMTAEDPGYLYIGFTGQLTVRPFANAGQQLGGAAYCRRFGITRLVHVESYDDYETARTREICLKLWKREWKLSLISKNNPAWHNLLSQVSW